MTCAAGLLTAEISRASSLLPHRDLSDAIKRILVAALGSAWAEVRSKLGDGLPNSSEKEITAVLARQLNRIREDFRSTTGFTGALFQNVVREEEVFTYDGKSLGKKPDLTIRLVSRKPARPLSEYGALFVECKIVDRRHSVNIYGRHGIGRYVSGEYAWAMPSALMIGYARDSYSVPKDLRLYLIRDREGANTCRTISFPRRHNATAGEIEVFVSEHERPWTYPATDRSPGQIALLHLWLNAD